MQLILHYIPYVLLFAAATALIYGWGLWRTMRQKQDLSNMLSSKGIAKIRKTLRKNGPMTRRELEPVVKDLTAKQPFQSKQAGGYKSQRISEFYSSVYAETEDDYGRKKK